jgi:hypothetical protein
MFGSVAAISFSVRLFFLATVVLADVTIWAAELRGGGFNATWARAGAKLTRDEAVAQTDGADVVIDEGVASADGSADGLER